MKYYDLLLLLMFSLVTSCGGKNSTMKSSNSEIESRDVRGNIVGELGASIMVVYQDKKNVYWFGSWDSGVYRYDGSTLINYTTKHGLPNNRIDEIKEDDFGNIYFTSCHPISTVTKFDGNIFTTLTAISSNDWKLNPTDLWFRHSFRNEKVYRYDGVTLHELNLPEPPEFSDPFEIYTIYKDTHGNIWFGSNPVGVCRYDGESFEWITEEDVTEFRDEGANGVRSIVEDVDGDFWFNTEYVYSVYDSTILSSREFYTRFESIGSLDGEQDGNLDEYLSVVKDNDDNLWFVTYQSGVWKYNGKTIDHFRVKDDSKDISLFSIYKDNSGHLWLGTHANGAYKFDGSNFLKFKP